MIGVKNGVLSSGSQAGLLPYFTMAHEWEEGTLLGCYSEILIPDALLKGVATAKGAEAFLNEVIWPAIQPVLSELHCRFS